MQLEKLGAALPAPSHVPLQMVLESAATATPNPNPSNCVFTEELPLRESIFSMKRSAITVVS